MSKSSKSRLDEYDPVIDYHHLKFENRCLRASGDDFQSLFEAIMVRARPGEFERVRPYGKYGDRKCDGLIESEGIIFQVYSPDELKQAEVQKKIDEDLEGAVQHWRDILKKWIFVYNVKRGITADIKLTLQQKQQQYPDIEIDCWDNGYLWEIARNRLSLQQRCEILGAPPWNFGKPKKNFHLPNPPSHLLERSTDLGVLKNLLLSSSSLPLGIAGSTSKVGLYGMGGIGKSVLAGMLARDEEVQAVFPDGVFWIPLGQEPILTLKQLNFAQMLGDGSLTFQDVQQGKIHLSQLLDNKQCLLILDDVWQVEHIAAFDVLSEQSKLLFTSRDSRIVKALNAIEYQVNLLSNDEALELLATCSGQAMETLPVEAHGVIQECGNLPLALSMIGAIAKARPNRWDNLLHKLRNVDLDKIRHQFPDYPYPDLLKVIQVSVDALEPESRIRYLDFAVFPEDVAIPEETLRIFWAPEGLDEYDTQDIIDVLVERSLARRDEVGNINLHDLQYDYVRKQITNLSTLHNRILEAYAVHCPKGWSSYLKSDSYFFEYLSYHLQISKRNDELYQLLTASPDWMEAKFIACRGDTSYVADLERTIGDFRDPIDLNQLLVLVRLYAARHAVNHRTQYYDDHELQALAWLGRVDEAISYARLRLDPRKRFRGLLAICNVLQKNEKINFSLLNEVWEITQTIESDWKSRLLSELAVALHRAGQVTEANTVVTEARNIAYSIRYKIEQDGALDELVSALTQIDRLDEALKVAQDIEEKWSRAEAMGSLAAGLILAERVTEAETALTEALSLAQDFADSEDFHEPWISVCSKWAIALAKIGCFDEAIEWIEDIEDTSRVEVLCELAVELDKSGLKTESDEIFDEIKEIANQIEINDIRITTLRKLVVELAQVGNTVEANLVLNQVKDLLISKENSRLVVTLGDLGLSLTQIGYRKEGKLIFTKAREIIQTVSQKHEKEWALGKLATSLAQAGYKALAEIAFIEIKEIAGGIGNRSLVKVMAQAGYFIDAKEIALMIEDEKDRSWALSDLVEELAKSKKFSEAENVAQTITNTFSRANAFTEIAKLMINSGIAENARKKFAEAEATISMIEDPTNKAISLIELTKAMIKGGVSNAKRLFPEVKKAIENIDQRTDRDYVVMEYVDGHPELEIGIEVGLSSWKDERNQKRNSENLAFELANEQSFSEAFNVFSKRPVLSYSLELEEFLTTLGSWASAFDKVEPGLSLLLLQEAIHIVGWVHSGWREIFELMKSQKQETLKNCDC